MVLVITEIVLNLKCFKTPPMHRCGSKQFWFGEFTVATVVTPLDGKLENPTSVH